MQKLLQLQAYKNLAESQSVVFVHPQDNLDQARLVKFRLITEQPVTLKVSLVPYNYDTGEIGQEVADTRLLTVVQPGFEEVEFYYQGTFALNVLGGDIWLSTFDNAFVSTQPSDLTNYARLWEREERDPRILEIERAARYNQARLAEQMQQDFARHAEALEAKYAKSAAASDATSGAAGSEQQEVSTGAPAGDPPAAAPAGNGTGGE